MSWSSWSESIKSQGFVAGGIYGMDGSPWSEFGTDTQYKFSGDDIKTVLKYMQNGMDDNPVRVNGVKQMIVKSDPSYLLGKKGTESCIVAVKCNQCVMVGVGGNGSEPRQLFDPLSKIAEPLKASGY